MLSPFGGSLESKGDRASCFAQPQKAPGIPEAEIGCVENQVAFKDAGMKNGEAVVYQQAVRVIQILNAEFDFSFLCHALV